MWSLLDIFVLIILLDPFLCISTLQFKRNIVKENLPISVLFSSKDKFVNLYFIWFSSKERDMCAETGKKGRILATVFCILGINCCMWLKKRGGEQPVTIEFLSLIVVNVMSQWGGKCGWYVYQMDWCMGKGEISGQFVCGANWCILQNSLGRLRFFPCLGSLEITKMSFH